MDPTPPTQVHQVANGDQNILVGVGNVTVLKAETRTAKSERRWRTILLDKVEHFWIDGVLRSATHDVPLCEVMIEPLAGAVQSPWAPLLAVPEIETLAPGRGISDAFVASGRLLLVLGAPGSGKTTILLELAQSLISASRREGCEVMPVVFHLSSWALERKPLAAWMVDELQTKYSVRRNLAQRWVEQSAILPLLDAFDEVDPATQEACIDAINDFIETQGPPGVVVCSRTVDYLRLPWRLKLHSAIRLLPLTPAQITDSLRGGSPRLSELELALHNDRGLLELASSPLMLSVLANTYRDTPLHLSEVHDINAPRVLALYVDRMFERKGSRRQAYTKADTLEWLRRLAGDLRRSSQGIFLIEQLQPTILRSRLHRWVYTLLSRPLAVLSVALPFLLLGHWTRALLWGMIWQGFGAGLIDGWKLDLGVRDPRKDERISWQDIWLFWHFTSAFGLPFFFALTIDNAALLTLLLLGVLFAFLFGMRSRRPVSQSIMTASQLIWTPEDRAWKRTMIGFLLVYLPAVFGWGLIRSRLRPRMPAVQGIVPNVESPDFPVLQGFGCVLLALAAIALLALLVGIVRALRHDATSVKTLPNHGIVLSIRSGLLAWLLIGGSVEAVAALFLFWENEQPTVGLFLPGLTAGLLGCLWCGGLEVLQHYVLRIMLWATGAAPLNYRRFLDYAARLTFLREVGGGYIFLHPLLLEHFAAAAGQGRTVPPSLLPPRRSGPGGGIAPAS